MKPAADQRYRPSHGNRRRHGARHSNRASRVLLFLLILALGSGGYIIAKKRKSKADAGLAAPVATFLATGKLSAGKSHVMALDTSGFPYAWGNVANRDASLAPQSFNVPTPGISRRQWREIYVGTRATYALQEDGALWRIAPEVEVASGNHGDYQIDLSRNLEVELFAPGFHWRRAMEMWGVGAGIDDTGQLWYWMDEDLQNVGKTSLGGPRGWPQRLGADRTFTDFCLTGTRVYTIASDGTLWRTGDLGNRHHYSGVIPPVPEDTEDPEALRPIPVNASLAKIFCTRAAMNVFVIDTEGGLWAFGPNYSDALGDGDGDFGSRPEPVPETAIKRIGDRRWATLALDWSSTFGIAQDGSLWGWGDNSEGQLGLGDSKNRDRPALIDNSRKWVAVTAGDYFGAALTDQGEIYTWGINGRGRLGDGGVAERRLTPTKVFSDVVFAGPTPN